MEHKINLYFLLLKQWRLDLVVLQKENAIDFGSVGLIYV